MKPNPFSDINIMTQQQAIFCLNIACTNHNPDGTHYDIQYIHIVQIYFRYLEQLWTVQQSNINLERTSRVK